MRIRGELDSLWIAHVPPYTVSRLQRLLTDVKRSPSAKVETIGQTVQQRDLSAVTITDFTKPDATKKCVWLIARQHAWEAGTSFVMEGALRFITSDEPRARALRERMVFKFIPMMAQDGVVPLAGATDLFVALNAGTLEGNRFLNLWSLRPLRRIGVQDGVLSIGTLATYSAIVGSRVVRRHLAQAGIFELSHVRAPEPEQFRADFSRFDVVIPYYCPVPSAGRDPAWPEDTRAALDRYVRDGGGLVIIHAASNAFASWPEYNHMTGLGGWGGRDATAGSYLYLDESGHVLRSDEPGPAGHHEPEFEYAIDVRAPPVPERVGEDAIGERAGDVVFACREDAFEIGRSRETLLARQFADRIHRRAGVVAVAPAADHVEVLQAEADGIDGLVAAHARGIGAVAFGALAQVEADDARILLFERGHVGGRRRRFLAEHAVEHPGAAFHRAGAVGQRGHRQHAGHGQHATAVAVAIAKPPSPTVSTIAESPMSGLASFSE